VVGGCLALSEHAMTEFSVRGEVKREASKTTTMDFWRADFGLLRTLVERVPWERVLKSKGVQKGWTFLKEEVLKAQQQAVPMCCKTNQWGRQPAWLNRVLFFGLRKKRRVYHLCKKGQVTQEEYKGLAGPCREEIRKAKAQLELRLATVVRDNKKYFYNTSTTKRGPRRVSILYWMQGGTLTTRMRNRLRHFVPSLPQSLIVRLVIPMGSQPPVLEDREGEQNRPPITQEEAVNELLCHLDTYKSMGLDGIHTRVLRELTEELAKTLSIICQQSWLTGEVLDDWRIASVTPIYKKGWKENSGNYRPVSLTSVLGKIMELFILSALSGHVKENR